MTRGMIQGTWNHQNGTATLASLANNSYVYYNWSPLDTSREMTIGQVRLEIEGRLAIVDNGYSPGLVVAVLILPNGLANLPGAGNLTSTWVRQNGQYFWWIDKLTVVAEDSTYMSLEGSYAPKTMRKVPPAGQIVVLLINWSGSTYPSTDCFSMVRMEWVETPSD